MHTTATEFVPPGLEVYRRMAASDRQLEDLRRALDPTLPVNIVHPDRHARAVAQAEAAGITALRDVWTMSA